MSITETVDLAVNSTEAKSISTVASMMTQRIGKFAEKHGVEDQYDEKKIEAALIYFMVKRHTTRLEELEISILDDGSISTGDTITGKRRADLVLRLHYKDERGVA